ncbi:MAG: DUF1223 domain-containing protein, partial [Verrucomicrobia bacterium]|nr:DUF1223 domain-containing protein [Verrucomicrobiota bacterium]
MKSRLLWAGFSVWALSLLTTAGQENFTLSVTSTVTRVSLVELFTSEGCSSCPPAEAWLGSHIKREGLWTTFIPVAFHVDYWDDMGWKDRFASPVFTHRQRRYKDAWAGRYMYTPAVVVQGLEWPQWRDPNATIGRDTNAVGRLSL